jgi:hypothetical protein
VYKREMSAFAFGWTVGAVAVVMLAFGGGAIMFAFCVATPTITFVEATLTLATIGGTTAVAIGGMMPTFAFGRTTTVAFGGTTTAAFGGVTLTFTNNGVCGWNGGKGSTRAGGHHRGSYQAQILTSRINNSKTINISH